MIDQLAAARRIGLLGGTFDPIHYGHLLMAEEACEQFALDLVVFIPNGRPAHKQGIRITSPEERLEMCDAAIAGNPRFLSSRVEMDRPGLSYAIDTVSEFRRAYPGLDALYFITGADAILELLTWRRAADFPQYCDFIAATRPGCDMSHLPLAIGDQLAAHVHFMPIPGIDISSTDLRKRAAERRSIRYQTPDPVAEFIAAHGLYRS